MDNLPPHDHCRYCGCAVPFEQAYCSEECYYKDKAKKRKERRNALLWAVFGAGGIIVIAAIGYIF